MPGATVVVHDVNELALALDLHVALAAGADRLQQRVVAEARDLDAQLLGGADDQRARRHGHLLAVDRERHLPRAHDATSRRPAPGWRSGHRPSRTCASYSSSKCCSVDEIGDTAPSARAQNARNRMFSPDLGQERQVLLAAVALLDAGRARASPTTCPRGTACTCRRTRGRRTRTRRRGGLHDAVALVHHHAPRRCRAASRPPRSTRSRDRTSMVLGGEHRGRRPARASRPSATCRRARRRRSSSSSTRNGVPSGSS